LASAATRFVEGNTSQISSMVFAKSSPPPLAKPVILPPGRAKLEIRPVPTGSPALNMTIGISVVACLAAVAAGVSAATITSTLRRTRSSANARR
jgi:hypothetical protein